MDVTYTDADLADVGELRGFALDIEEGDERNDFDLSLDMESPLRIEPGALVYCDGTEWGGVVDSSESSPADGLIHYRGRTWTGVLCDKVLEPDAGKAYLTVSGEANAVLLQLIGRMGLGGRFTVPTEASGIQVSHTFERYCTAYSGIRAMLASSGAKLMVRCDAGVVALSAAPIADYSDGPDTDRADVGVSRDHRPYNHLVSLGSGEGTQRVVRHDYADAEGNVSQTQTLFGIDERTAVYDYNNADADELAEKGPEKLRELQDGSSWDADLREGWDYDIGDVVPGIDVMTGEEVYAAVGCKIARITDSSCSIEYRAGGTASDASLSGSSESSGGGVSYTPGKGISIVGRTISADVDADDLGAVADTAQGAATLASNASASAAAKVAGVEGTAPISASVDEGHVATVTHNQSGVTAGTYGPASSLTPAWGETVTIPPRVTVNATGHVTKAEGRTLKIPAATATQSAAGLMSAADKQAVDAMHDDYAAKEHAHDASDIETGTLPIARGGTGKATAKAAQNALLGNMNELTSAPGDTGEFVMMYTTPDDTHGAVFKRKITKVWEWFKAKTDALYAAKAHTHLYAASDTAGGAAKEAEKLETPRTITLAGAVTGAVQFDGSANVTMSTEADIGSAGFLAAHPVGSTFEFPTDPGVTYGGTWAKQPGNMGCLKWERTA